MVTRIPSPIPSLTNISEDPTVSIAIHFIHERNDVALHRIRRNFTLLSLYCRTFQGGTQVAPLVCNRNIYLGKMGKGSSLSKLKRNETGKMNGLAKRKLTFS